MKKITDSDYKIIKKYNININENMNIDDILDEIEAKMFEMGFEENDEINNFYLRSKDLLFSCLFNIII